MFQPLFDINGFVPVGFVLCQAGFEVGDSVLQGFILLLQELGLEIGDFSAVQNDDSCHRQNDRCSRSEDNRSKLFDPAARGDKFSD